MKKIFHSLFITCFLSLPVLAQQTANAAKNTGIQRPKLVVGIVIDQMRWDYLYRYNNRFGQAGFKRLLNQGFSCENTFLPYLPTYTAVGHTCVYTGSVPAVHGIIGNNWYDRSLNRNMYCSEDSTVQAIGGGVKAGKMSPNNLLTTTITDELRLASNFKSKVIGIALKDRGAIFPAGHSANAAYWFDDGNWMTSNYYMEQLPGWVNDYNAKQIPAKAMKGTWNTLYPIETYTQSTADNKIYEAGISGLKGNTFPYYLDSAGKKKFEAFKFTPFAADYTFDFAKTAIDKERMGSADVTDFLCISISSTDYAGHAFGPNSIEIEDTYLRLDQDIESFLKYLDQKIGKGNYTVFLTADHAVAHVPGFLKENKIPAGFYSDSELQKQLNEEVGKLTGFHHSITKIMNYQVYLNKEGIEKAGQNIANIIDIIKKEIIKNPFIAGVYDLPQIMNETLAQPMRERMINGYNEKRSGDIQMLPLPGYFSGTARGTTHGTWNAYDAHIPLLFYGWGIQQGKLNREVYMTDIAPTIAALLHIQMPNGAVGKVIEDVIKK